MNVRRGAPRYMLENREVGRLQRWGLVEPRRNDDPKKKDSALWRPTRKGILFAQGRISIPKDAYVYQNEVLRYSTDRITIVDCFENTFDYQELMNG